MVGIIPLIDCCRWCLERRWVLLFWAGFEHGLQSALQRSAATGRAGFYNESQRRVAAPLYRDGGVGLAHSSALERLHASSRFFLRKACDRGRRHRRGAHHAEGTAPAALYRQAHTAGLQIGGRGATIRGPDVVDALILIRAQRSEHSLRTAALGLSLTGRASTRRAKWLRGCSCSRWRRAPSNP